MRVAKELPSGGHHDTPELQKRRQRREQSSAQVAVPIGLQLGTVSAEKGSQRSAQAVLVDEQRVIVKGHPCFRRRRKKKRRSGERTEDV